MPVTACEFESHSAHFFTIYLIYTLLKGMKSRYIHKNIHNDELLFLTLFFSVYSVMILSNNKGSLLLPVKVKRDPLGE